MDRKPQGIRDPLTATAALGLTVGVDAFVVLVVLEIPKGVLECTVSDSAKGHMGPVATGFSCSQCQHLGFTSHDKLPEEALASHGAGRQTRLRGLSQDPWAPAQWLQSPPQNQVLGIRVKRLCNGPQGVEQTGLALLPPTSPTPGTS